MIDTILKWVGSFINWLSTTTGSYMIALVLFALVVEIIMLPLSIKQQKNSIKQAKLRPKEMAIRKKYKGREDKETQQQIAMEIQELYQRENFNQLSGCLPLLIQLPVIIALYNVVIDPLKYVVQMSNEAISAIREFITLAADNGGLGATLTSNSGTIEVIGKIKEFGLDAFSGMAGAVENGEAGFAALEGAFANGLPNFQFFSLDLSQTPSFVNFGWLLLIPLFTFVAQYGSMKLTRKFTYQPTTAETKEMGCSNKIMDIVMPLFSVYIAFVVPAAVGVYWIMKSIISTFRQYVLAKTMPMPQFTEEDYKAAERAINGKNIKTRPRSTNPDGTPKKVRSLHYIDDDEDEPVSSSTKKSSGKSAAELPAANAEASESQGNENGLIEKPKMKEDVPASERRKQKKNKNNSEAADGETATEEIIAPASEQATDGAEEKSDKE